ncbi:MAG TPA: hypothetical protein VGP90_15630, partial [Acidimicrobiia bacterium]|nr:hypothetical protein [Acidimicrobiia bacterium]
WVSGWFASTGAAIPPETAGGTALASAKRGPEPAPTDSELQAAPDDLHAEGPAAPAKAEIAAATAGRHGLSGPTHGGHRPKGRSVKPPSPTVRLRPHRAGEHRAAS